MSLKDLASFFEEIGKVAVEKGRGTALLIDDIHSLRPDELLELLMALHRTVQRGLPVAFAASGLPHILGLLGEARSYGDRLFDFMFLNPLDDDSVYVLGVGGLLIGYAGVSTDEQDLTAQQKRALHATCYPSQSDHVFYYVVTALARRAPERITPDWMGITTVRET